ncbi:hypothetical protein HK405_014286 [Cladochytrium tenue]|nr:hypothetical protein HK405_014286 [Cladochytrium tenue]
MVEYSGRSFVVIGSETIVYKDTLKGYGGKFCKGLTVGGTKVSGWVFPLSLKGDLSSFVASKGGTVDGTTNASKSTETKRKSGGADDTGQGAPGPTAVDASMSADLKGQDAHPAKKMKHEKNDRGGMFVVYYSKASVVVCGDTFEFKDELKAMGGKFNRTLLVDGVRMPGWVLPIAKADAAAKWVSEKIGTLCEIRRRTELKDTDDSTGGNATATEIEASPHSHSLHEDTRAKQQNDRSTQPKEDTSTEAAAFVDTRIRVVGYTDKSIAVVGDTRAYKEVLAKMGGRFNSRLRPTNTAEGGDGSQAGWVFAKNRRADVEAWVTETQRKTEASVSKAL